MKLHEKFFYLTLCVGMIIIGTLFVSIKSGWIIFHYPSYTQDIAQQKAVMRVNRTPIIYSFYKDGAWHTEYNELSVSPDTQKMIHYVVNSWLSFLHEEHIMKKRVTAHAVLISANGNDLFISFDRNPLQKESSIYEKWMWIEGLLKTIRAQGIKIAHVHFLVHHQPLQDAHLDFENPWPIAGYANV